MRGQGYRLWPFGFLLIDLSTGKACSLESRSELGCDPRICDKFFVLDRRDAAGKIDVRGEAA